MPCRCDYLLSYPNFLPFFFGGFGFFVVICSMNVDKLDGNWNNTSQKPEDDATIFVAVGVSARFGGGYRVEAAVYDAENDCITLLSSYKGGEAG